MLEIIENNNRHITIIREEFWEFKIDVYLSSLFKQCSPDLIKWFEYFYNNKIKWIIPAWKDIFVFCFYDYDNLDKLINDLEKEWHYNIKNSDIYLYYEDSWIYKINLWKQ